MLALGLTLLLSCFLISNAVKSPYLTTFDKETLKTVFNSGFSKGFNDVQSVALSIRGYELLDEKFDREKDACNLFRNTFVNSEKINDIHSSAYGAFLIKSEKCVLDISKTKKALVELDKITTIENLFKTVHTLSLLKLEINTETVKKLLDGFLKRDSSAINQAYGYYIASEIYKNRTDLKKYFVEIEDTIQQADEADNVYMYYDDGIFATSFIINSIFELSQQYGEAPPISMEKLTKFSNFLLSRRYTYQLRSAVELTASIKVLSKNKFNVPLATSLVDNVIDYRSQPKVKISINNLWGDQIDNAKVVAETIKNIQSAVTVITKKSVDFDRSSGMYELDLSTTQEQLSKGFYSIKLDVKVNETRFAGIASPTLTAKIVSDVTIDNAELSIKERDQITGILNYKLTMGSILSDKLNMNWHHRLDMKFTIRDSGMNFRAHQVFMKLTHYNTKQEIIFVVEPDRNDVYKFSLDLEKSNKDFDNLSGDYKMELVVGDAVIRTPENWIFANIKLDMPSSPSTDNTGESRRTVAGSKRSIANPRIGQGPSVAKPQIFHMFKPAEKRGGQLISTIFTILCIVPPFVMIILWVVLGVNISNFQFALSPLLFHVGILSIFGLYYCYWSYLNMFTTLKYMIPLGSFTAFFGNRVLRQIAAKRKEA